MASGAIRPGIELLLKLRAASRRSHCVFLAGGFGNYIRRGNAQWIGLLPPGIEHQRIRYHATPPWLGRGWRGFHDDVGRLERPWPREPST